MVEPITHTHTIACLANAVPNAVAPSRLIQLWDTHSRINEVLMVRASAKALHPVSVKWLAPTSRSHKIWLVCSHSAPIIPTQSLVYVQCTKCAVVGVDHATNASVR
jgi:hypothetical protein